MAAYEAERMHSHGHNVSLELLQREHSVVTFSGHAIALFLRARYMLVALSQQRGLPLVLAAQPHELLL